MSCALELVLRGCRGYRLPELTRRGDMSAAGADTLPGLFD
ncbi:hypothetical protein [Pseudomonas sp. 1D4]